MDKTKSFEELIVWQKSYAFTLSIYQYTKNFPKEERYGVTSQLRRAVASVTANITEGYKRLGKKDKLKFLNFAEASLGECQFFIMLSFDLMYLDNAAKTDLDNRSEEVGRLLTAYCKAIRNNNTPPPTIDAQG
ncbi:MAG: four helix bundle protein [Prevotellaceae bacterium]|jgi:four helix bundle protein|nr:four helix bundle protein [Prevotellaceae bacterium]